MTPLGPYAHADQMVLALLFHDRHLRRRLLKSSLTMTGLYALVMVMPMFMQNQLFGELKPEMAGLAAFLSQVAGGGMTAFAFVWAAQYTQNLARTVMDERLALRTAAGEGNAKGAEKGWKQASKLLPLFLPLGAFFWWQDLPGVALLMVVSPYLSLPFHWLSHIQPADLPPGSTAKEDALPMDMRAHMARSLVSMVVLGLTFLLGLFMAGVGLLLILPLAAGLLALLEGRLLRHQRFLPALSAVRRHGTRVARWDHGRWGLLWALGAPALAIGQALQTGVGLLLLLPVAALLWTHGVQGLTEEVILQSTTLHLWTAPLTLPLLGFVACVSAFVYQAQAIWFTRLQDELEEGTAMQVLLDRLEGEEAA